MLKVAARWFCYATLLMLFYAMSMNGILGFRPLLILPLAAAVSFFEAEFESAVFGVFCGFFMDMAADRLFGFTSLWLMICCMLLSLLSTYLIRRNLFNYLLSTAALSAIVGFIDYVFSIYLWQSDAGAYTVTHLVIPAMLSALVLSPIIYWFIKLLNKKLSTEPKRSISSAVGDAEDSADKVRS